MQVRNSDAHVHSAFHGFIGTTPQIRHLFDALRRLAVTEWPALLVGETGTGKELLAQAIHQESPRAEGPFVAVNCGALSPSLAASELFGHVKGAFTGADTARIGAFARAQGGTLFLDEVGDLPPETQSMLLRALETGQFLPVGSDAAQPCAADIRLVSATNRPLQQGQGFRLDLYHRLATFVLALPPLRERSEDIPLIARSLLAEQSPGLHLDDLALAALQTYDWPGNVRELRNLLRRVSAFSEGPTVSARALQLPEIASEALQEIAEDTAAVEALLIETRAAGGVIAKAARQCDLSNDAYRRRLLKVGLDPAVQRRVARFAQAQRFCQLLQEERGNVSAAARAAGQKRTTFTARIKRAREELEDALRKTHGDLAQASLILGVSEIDLGALDRALQAVERRKARA